MVGRKSPGFSHIAVGDFSPPMTTLEEYAFLVAHRDYISEGSKPPLMVRACNQSRGSLFRVSGRDDSLDMIRARFRQTLGITVEEAEAAWLATLQ
jgi:hypothetical protein